MKHFNKLTPAQAERLALLAEECGEVIQVVGKILRHGLHSHHPDDPHTTNAVMLVTELAHIQVAVDMLYDHRDLDMSGYHSARNEKRSRIGKYLHHPETPRPPISHE